MWISGFGNFGAEIGENGLRAGPSPHQQAWVPLGVPTEIHLCPPHPTLCSLRQGRPQRDCVHTTSCRAQSVQRPLFQVPVIPVRGADMEGRSVNHFSVLQEPRDGSSPCTVSLSH